ICACVVVPWGLRGRAGELTARGHVAAFGQCGGDSRPVFIGSMGFWLTTCPIKKMRSRIVRIKLLVLMLLAAGAGSPGSAAKSRRRLFLCGGLLVPCGPPLQVARWILDPSSVRRRTLGGTSS